MNSIHKLEQLSLEQSNRTIEYTFFSDTSSTSSRADNMLNYKTNLDILKIGEIIESMFPDHIGIKSEINN